MRHGSPHLEGRRTNVRTGPNPWSRRNRRYRESGFRRHDLSSRRPRPHFVHLGVRPLRILPSGKVLPLHDRRLDPRQCDRRHTGRIRSHSSRRYQPLSNSGRRRRKSSCDAERSLDKNGRGACRMRQKRSHGIVKGLPITVAALRLMWNGGAAWRASRFQVMSSCTGPGCSSR